MDLKFLSWFLDDLIVSENPLHFSNKMKIKYFRELEGKEISMPCVAEGTSRLNVIWLKNQEKFSLRDRPNMVFCILKSN